MSEQSADQAIAELTAKYPHLAAHERIAESLQPPREADR